MAEFTFLELHLDDATITNNAPYSGADPDAADEPETEEGSSLPGLLVLGVVLAIAALAVLKVKSGGEDEPSGLV